MRVFVLIFKLPFLNQDILACSDPVADMNERTQLAVDIDCACIQQCLMRRDDNSIGVHVLNASTMVSQK